MAENEKYTRDAAEQRQVATTTSTTSTTLSATETPETPPQEHDIIPKESGGSEPEEDLERGPSEDEGKGSEQGNDPRMIGWSSPDDPENPRNWSFGRKWAAVGIVSCFTFITPVASSMVAPALPYVDADLGITSSIVSQLTLSIFILSYAIGPLLLGPLSEVYGRVVVLQLANLFFMIFNLVCGFAQTTTQLVIFRLLAGLGGSAPMAVGGGVLGDCFTNEQRGLAVALYSLGPIMGPALGPVAGGFISGNISWRWCFWIVTIADAVVQLLGFFFLQETYAPVLLERRAARLRKETGDLTLRPVTSHNDIPLLKRLRVNLIRPTKMLCTQPAVIVLSLYQALLYGITYLVISTFTTLWTEEYHQSTGIAGLHYLSLAIGFTIGAQTSARFNDWNYKRLKARNNGVGLPEFRMYVMIPGSILCPIGLFWYGWSAQAKIFWLMPDIGLSIFACGFLCASQAVQTYLIDTYTRYAASAISAMNSLRSLAGFGFPLFATYMYGALGYGWGNSLLAFIAIVIGGPAPWLFWRYGATLRKMSPYAAGE